MKQKVEITEELINQIREGVEKEYCTIVNSCGIMRQGENEYEKISKEGEINKYDTHPVIGYLVVPILFESNQVLYKTYNEENRYLNSPTRMMESWFNYESAKKKIEDKLKDADKILKTIESYSGEKTAGIVKIMDEPYLNESSKIIENMAEIDNSGYIFIYFKEGVIEEEPTEPVSIPKEKFEENESQKTSRLPEETKSWWQKFFSS